MFDKAGLVGGSVDVVHYLRRGEFFGCDAQSFGHIVIEEIFCCPTVDKGNFGSRPMF